MSNTSSRTSNNFIQIVTDDGHLDYTADWNTFSFEAEINTRKNILTEDLNAYNELLDQSTDNIFDDINDLQAVKVLYSELLTKNENVSSEYKSLVEEYKRIKENIVKLTEKNDMLEEALKKLKDEETTSRKAYQQMKLALHKAHETYTTYFGIDVSTNTLSDSTYEACVHFKQKDNAVIKFTVDRKKRKVLDCCTNGALLPKQEEEIRKKFTTLDNLPGLFCALRDIILKK